MKKYFALVLVVAVICAFAIPACAETVFNDMSKCVQSWGKGCQPCTSKEAPAAAPKIVKSVDAIGNQVSLVTDNSGKNMLGK